MSAPGHAASVLLATLTATAPDGTEITGELRDYGGDVTASARAGRYELERDIDEPGERWHWDGGVIGSDGVPRTLRAAMRSLVEALIEAHRR